MMSLLTLGLLLAELALYAAIARALGLPLAWAPLGLVITRAAVVALLCLLSRCGSWRVFVRETWAMFALYTFGLLLQRWLAPRDPARVAPGVLPVLFVHGILCNAGVWHRQLRALRGVDNLFTLNLTPPLASMESFAAQLARRAEEVCRSAGTDRLVLVGHSMGGLVARAWIARHGGAARTARLVTLGSPHQGSLLARRVPARWAVEMVCGCPWLEQLATDGARAGSVPTTSIYSLHDEFVRPQESARLNDARNVALERLGHLELLAAPRVHALVEAEIAAARGERPS